MKRKITSLIQLIIGIAIIAFIFIRMENKEKLVDAVNAAAGHWPLLLAGSAASLLCLTISAIRWKLLLDAQGMELPFGRIASLYLIGHFFNAFMPGAVGGDVVKAYYVAKETDHKKAQAVATVFIDRLIGLLALIMLCTVVMSVRLPFFMQYRETRIALFFNAGLFLGTSAVLFIVFRKNIFECWPFFKRLEENTSLGRIISKIYNAFHICLKHPGLLTKTILLSVINHVSLVVCAFFMGMALNITCMSFMDYLALFLIINAIAAIPATPGGLGTREVATKFLLGIMGVPETSAIPLSLLVYGSLFFWSIIGGIIYIGYSSKQGKPPMELMLDQDQNSSLTQQESVWQEQADPDHARP